MPVKTRSSEDDLDLSPDALGTSSASKSKSSKKKSSRPKSKSRASKKKKSGTDAPNTNTPVKSPQLEPSSTDSDLGEPQAAAGSFPDYIIGGPGSSIDLGGTTKHMTLPSAPLISTPSGPILGTGQGQYYLFVVSSPVDAIVKTKLPLDFEKSSTLTLGRDSANAIVIPDQVVSRNHAQLATQDGRVFLKDMQSTNGTFLYDGTDFQPVNDVVEVRPNSVIRFGNHTIVKLIRE